MFEPKVTETEFKLRQSDYIVSCASADVKDGVCYALAYLWVKQGLKQGGHLNMELKVSLQKKFSGAGAATSHASNRASAGGFLRDVGGNPNGFGQTIYSMQRAIGTQQSILRNKGSALSLNSGLKIVALRDGYTENLIANGKTLNRFEPFSTFIKWMRDKRGSLNEGYCLIGFRGDKGGHAIAVQTLPGGRWRIFDSNFGSFRFDSYDRFKSIFNELGLRYVAEDVAGGNWMISTFR